MTIKAAYVANITEYEQGWGSRPEGTLASLDKPALDAKIKEISAAGSYACFCRASEVRVAEVSAEQYARLENAA